MRSWLRRKKMNGGALPKHHIGGVLLELGLVTKEQLDAAAKFKAENPDVMLGEALVRQGFLCREDLEAVLLKQAVLRRPGNKHVLAFARAATRRTVSATALMGVLGDKLE